MGKESILLDRHTSPGRFITQTGARIAPLALALCMALAMAACAVSPERSDPAASADEMYEAGRAALEREDFDTAVAKFRRLEIEYPEDRHAIQGQMEIVYAYYQNNDPDSAIAAAGRFIRSYPDHANLDYLFYLRGLASFDRAVEELTQANASASDPRPPSVDLTLQYLSELIGRYPESRYSEDARMRILHLRRQLAEFELGSAKKHLNRGEYSSAGLRARSVIEHYPDSGLAMEAATVINMAHRMLNMEGADRPRGAREPSVPPARLPDPTPDPIPDLIQDLRSATDAAPSPIPGTATAGIVPAADVQLQPAEDHQREAPWREAWITQQNPDAYTIQLFSTSNEQALLSFIRRHDLGEAGYFQSRPSWYSLIHGIFDSAADARARVSVLPSAMVREEPWIRRVGDVQALISMQAFEDGRTD